MKDLQLKESGVYSSALFEELATDQDAPDLARTCSNLVQLCVLEKTTGCVLVHVSIPSQTLDSLDGRYDKHINMNYENEIDVREPSVT